MLNKLFEIWNKLFASKVYSYVATSPAEKRKKQLHAHLVSEPWSFMSDYTPQHEWIDEGGKFIWLALFLTELGAGVYFFSMLYNSLAGMIIGWIICMVLGCTSFLLHTGHPERLFGAVKKFQNSWISRGFTFVSLFGLFGLINIIVYAAGTSSGFLDFIMAIICLVVAVYAGMVLSFSNGIPLWNTGLLPFAFVIAALWGGAEILLGVKIIAGLPIEQIETWVRFLMPTFALIVILYLTTVWSGSNTGKASVKRFLMGDLAKYFYVGVVFIGLIIPFIVVLFSFLGAEGAIPKIIYLIAIACGIVGDLTIRFCIMKGAYYNPLI